ncbi:GYF domain-containing protein [Lysobacter tyrosinilyticus]
MIDWYYHDPSEGRVGPLSAEELCKRFHDRRIQRDTLVWHHGLREWQPLERMAPELGLASLETDSSHPPSLPSSAAPPLIAPRAPAVSAAVPRGKYTRAPLREKKTLSTTAIVLIALGALGIPALLVVGSFMQSAYKDYARRADSMGTLTGMSIGLKRVVGDYALRTGRCPDNEDPRVVQMRQDLLRRASAEVRFATIEGGCAFELALNVDGQPIDGKTLRYEGYPDAGRFEWTCTGGSMPERYRPYECRRGG